jgi:Tfp pilus assembly PilM family ATPase
VAWGIEIASDVMRLCRADAREGRIRLSAAVEAPVPSGLIQPSLKERNLFDPAALTTPLRELAARVGCRGWVRLALPDPVFLLRSVSCQEIPANRAEARQFLRWQIREAIPFPGEDARVDYLSGQTGPDGHVRAACLIARDRILTEYEALLESAGLRAALLNARSVALAQAASASLPDRPRAFIGGNGARTTLLLTQDGRPRVWRILIGQGRLGGESDRRFFREVSDSLTYFQESEGVGPVEEVLVAGLGARTPEIVSALAEWLDLPVTPLDLAPVLSARPAGTGPHDDLTAWGAAIGAAIAPC